MTPSKRRLRKCCEGKQRFETLKDAQGAMHGMKRRKEKNGTAIVTVMRAYGCACGGFHFGRTRGIDWELVARLSKPAVIRGTGEAQVEGHGRSPGAARQDQPKEPKP